MIPKAISLYGQLLEQKCIYLNNRTCKNRIKNKPNSRDKEKLNESSSKEYDSDSSCDSTYCSWWSDVYGFDMRVQREFIVIDDCNYKSNITSKPVHNKDCWAIMPEPIVHFFDPCKVICICLYIFI